MKTSSIGEIGSMGIIKGSREGLQNAVAGFERNVMTPESFFSALDGNQTTAKLANQGLSAGPYVENFWLPAKQLFKQRVVLKEDFGASKEVILSKFPQKYKQLSDTFDGKTFTYQEKIYALALSKNSDSLSRLMNSGFTISILDQMKKSIGILPGHDVVENPVVQSVFQYFHKGRPLVEGAIKDLTGETPDLPEFYAPMYNAVNRGNPSFDSKEIHALKDLTGTKAKPSTSRLKSIKKGVKLRLDLDLEKGMDRYADEVSRYPMIPYHNRAMKLLGQSSPSLSDEYSPFVVKNIREWLNDVTVGSPSTFGEFDKVIDKGRLLGYGFILSKNPFKIGAIQAASAFNAADLIGYSEFGEALSDIVANPQISDIIRKESPLMRTRFAHLEQQERALQTNTGISGPKNFLTKAERAYVKALGIPTSAVDKAMAGAGYLGSKRKWARLHPKSSNIDQINYAEDVVGNTQPMTQDLYRPSLTRRNVLGKTIAAFHTQRNQVASQQISTNNAYRNGKIGKIEWAKTHINQSLMPPLYLTLVSLAFTPPAKRNIKKATDFSIAYGKRVLGTLPLFSTWLGTLEYGKGKMRIPGFKPFEFVGENILKIMKDPELISALALSFESFMAMRGVNLQVPKNIAAVVKTAMEGDVDLQRLIKSGSETGDPLTTMERFKKGKRERSSNLRKRKAKMKRTLDDQINDILQL